MTATAGARGGLLDSPPRNDVTEARGAVLRLVGAAFVVWAVFCGIGFLITHPLRDTSFERWDGSANRRLADHRSSPWNGATHWLTYAAETVSVITIGAAFFIALRFTLHRWRESLFLAAALAGEATIFVATTFMIDRHRPPVPHLDDAPPTSSFPSGHTAAAVTLYGALAIIAVHVARRQWLRAMAVFAAVAMPVLVAFARLYRGMHFPTDVLGGALLAAVWLAITWTVILRPAGAPRETGPSADEAR